MMARIGYIENDIGKGSILFWFYRVLDNRWVRIRSEKIHVGYRDILLEQMGREAILVQLGKGT